ncbi:MAG TPA: RagB/SusD family nutrient uptake outer membrane protein [Prolixibacteraceae bacterium]|nr:RagB/SusD family nutrient uptake outer membrane protein [Prolixibacteraceae bacterium]
MDPLAFEGHQFYDIVRTGRAQKVLKEEAMNFATTSNVFVNDEGKSTTTEVTEQFGDNFEIGRNEVWAIPQNEIDNTNGVITQNPGY